MFAIFEARSSVRQTLIEGWRITEFVAVEENGGIALCHWVLVDLLYTLFILSSFSNENLTLYLSSNILFVLVLVIATLRITTSKLIQ